MQAEQSEQETMLNKAWDGAESVYQGVADRAGHLKDSTGEYLQEAPFTATLVSFGVGVGLGLLLAQLMAPQRRPQRWYDSYLGEDRAHRMEENLQHYVPRAIRRRMGV